jgi:hypothetical protein
MPAGLSLTDAADRAGFEDHRRALGRPRPQRLRAGEDQRRSAALKPGLMSLPSRVWPHAHIANRSSTWIQTGAKVTCTGWGKEDEYDRWVNVISESSNLELLFLL